MLIRTGVLTLAAVAGTVLLTACDSVGGDTAADQKPTTSTTSPVASSTESPTTSSTASPATDATTAEGGAVGSPVDCGQVDVGGGTHTLIADATKTAIVGCTEAFNVLDEYLAIPAAERGATLEGIAVSNGWSCTTDDGETASIGCVKGEGGAGNDDYDLAFHTEPVAA